MAGIKNPNTFVFFRSSTNKDTGVPSAIPCQRAIPVVKSVLGNNILQPFTFVDCEVSPNDLKNPDHPYVTHDNVKLKALPTLVCWGKPYKLEEGQLFDDGAILSFLKSVVTQ